MQDISITPSLIKGIDRYVSQRTETLTYRAAHNRVNRQRGKASQYECMDCPNPATEWSCESGELEGPANAGATYPSRYSADIYNYVPLCRSCHRKRDDAAVNLPSVANLRMSA